MFLGIVEKVVKSFREVQARNEIARLVRKQELQHSEMIERIGVTPPDYVVSSERQIQAFLDAHSADGPGLAGDVSDRSEGNLEGTGGALND